MKVLQSWILSLLIMMVCNNAISGSQVQKGLLSELMDRSIYYDMFSSKYYDQNSKKFNQKILNEIFEPTFDINNNPNLYSTIGSFYYGLSGDLPRYISTDNEKFLNLQLQDIESEYPNDIYNKLNNIMHKNNWYFLGWSGSAKLILSATLTGPKVGLDIVSGGLSKLAKAVTKGGKIKKLAKVIKFSKLKKLEKIEKKIVISLKKVFKGIKKFRKSNPKWGGKLTKYRTNKAKKMMAFFDSDAFSVYLYIVNSGLDMITLASSLTSEQKLIIKKYAENNKDDTNDILAQYFATLSTNKIILTAELLDKTTFAIYIKLFQTGVINRLSGNFNDVEIDTLAKNAWDITKTATEFIPVAGPIIEIANANVTAVANANSGRHQAIRAFTDFNEAKDIKTYFALAMYKLAVIEDTIQKIKDNNDSVITSYNTLDPDTRIKNKSSASSFLRKIIDTYHFNINDFMLNGQYFRPNNKVLSHQAEKLIRKAYKKINNMENQTLSKSRFFTSHKEITRGDFAKMTKYYGLVNEESIGIINTFKKLKISTNSNFRANEKITIYEFLVMLVRIMELNTANQIYRIFGDN